MSSPPDDPSTPLAFTETYIYLNILEGKDQVANMNFSVPQSPLTSLEDLVERPRLTHLSKRLTKQMIVEPVYQLHLKR